jgi:hypothetical protein
MIPSDGFSDIDMGCFMVASIGGFCCDSGKRPNVSYKQVHL